MRLVLVLRIVLWAVLSIFSSVSVVILPVQVSVFVYSSSSTAHVTIWLIVSLSVMVIGRLLLVMGLG